jgi:hypothetical protein
VGWVNWSSRRERFRLGDIVPSMEQLLADEQGSQSIKGTSYCSQLPHTPYYAHHFEDDLGDEESSTNRRLLIWRCTFKLSFCAKRTPVKKVD